MAKTLFVLGAGGFVGRELVTVAAKGGWRVKGLVRSSSGVDRLQRSGGEPLQGDILRPETWLTGAGDADILVDLAQPTPPKRFSRSALRRIARERHDMTRAVTVGLGQLPAAERPFLLSVSGVDDLQPDARGQISEQAALRSKHFGFSPIGIPARRIVEASGLATAYVYFGLVYGPGAVFADQIASGLAKGRGVVVGRGTNRLRLIHVSDVARALVHLAEQPSDQLAGRTILFIDGAGTRQRELLDFTAERMGVKLARTVPLWMAALVAGRGAVEGLAADITGSPTTLGELGFVFEYPSYLEGVPPTLEQLHLLKE